MEPPTLTDRGASSPVPPTPGVPAGAGIPPTESVPSTAGVPPTSGAPGSSEAATVAFPALGRPGEHCAQCGAGLAPDQRYCLNCGWRRADARVGYAEILRGEAAAGGDQAGAPGGGGAVPPGAMGAAAPAGGAGPRSVSPLGAALAAGLLLLAVLVGATIAGRSSDSPPQVVRVGGGTSGGTGVAATTAAFTSDWPGDDGYTVQLSQLPVASTQPAAVATAKTAATAKGATEVGALKSDDYGSLAAGQYIVYSGAFTSKSDAQARLDEVSGDFPDAKVIEVAATKGGAEAAGGGAAAKKKTNAKDTVKAVPAPPAALKGLQNATPEQYQKNSKKLPDVVGTGGTPPAKDNKKAGGGSDSVSIG